MKRMIPMAVIGVVLVVLVGTIWVSSRHTWSMETGAKVMCPPLEPYQYCTIEQDVSLRGHMMTDFSPDGRLYLSAAGSQIFVWNTGDGEVVLRRPLPNGNVRAIKFGHHDNFFAATFESVTEFSLEDGKPQGSVTGFEEIIGRLAVSNKGSILAISDEFELRLVSSPGRELLHMLDTGRIFVRALDFSPDDRLLAVGRRNLPLDVYNVETGDIAYTIPEESVFGLAFSPDGTTIYTAGYSDRIKRWNAENGAFVEEIGGHDFNIVALALSNDGERLASGGRDGVKVWDLSDNRLIKNLENHDLVTTMSFSPDGRLLLVSGMNRQARLWRLP